MEALNFLKARIKKKLNIKDPRFKSNQKIRAQLYKTDERFVQLNLSDKAKLWLQEFSSNGIVKIENEFDWVKDHFRSKYFDVEDNSYILKDLRDDRAVRTGCTFNKAVSLSDPELFEWYFNKDLIGFLGKNFKQQPYYRNQPLIQTYTFNKKHQKDMAGLWHVDGGLSQISFMLLISDISKNDTHMEYALKSTHNKHIILNRYQLDSKKIESEYEIMHCIGKAGTLYIFQGGMGYHRAVYKENTIRSIYHANFTPGQDIQNAGLEKKASFSDLENTPFYIKNCANMIVN